MRFSVLILSCFTLLNINAQCYQVLHPFGDSCTVGSWNALCADSVVWWDGMNANWRPLPAGVYHFTEYDGTVSLQDSAVILQLTWQFGIQPYYADSTSIEVYAGFCCPGSNIHNACCGPDSASQVKVDIIQDATSVVHTDTVSYDFWNQEVTFITPSLPQGHYYHAILTDGACGNIQYSDTLFIGNVGLDNFVLDSPSVEFDQASQSLVISGSSISEIVIFDLRGRRAHASAKTNVVELSSLPPGTYCYYLQDEQGSRFSGKFCLLR